jgi:hypothetical protein
MEGSNSSHLAQRFSVIRVDYHENPEKVIMKLLDPFD